MAQCLGLVSDLKLGKCKHLTYIENARIGCRSTEQQSDI
jgi:hypothetical protein